MKVVHKIINLNFIGDIFKHGTRKSSIVEGEVGEGAFLFHSFIDYQRRQLHLFFVDPINGIELMEGQDLLSVPCVNTVFEVIE